MTYESRNLAQSALKEILIGKQIVGMYFRTANIYFSTIREDGAIIPKNAYLHIENSWSFLQKDQAFPSEESEMSSRTAWQELAHTAISLGSYKVVDVLLGESVPNLAIYFENGAILYISGFNSMYESWEVTFDKFDIVATPCGSIMVWVPDNFAE
jgi:hypothetical protein